MWRVGREMEGERRRERDSKREGERGRERDRETERQRDRETERGGEKYVPKEREIVTSVLVLSNRRMRIKRNAD